MKVTNSKTFFLTKKMPITIGELDLFEEKKGNCIIWGED